MGVCQRDAGGALWAPLGMDDGDDRGQQVGERKETAQTERMGRIRGRTPAQITATTKAFGRIPAPTATMRKMCTVD